jgi:hypothetical protein
MGTARGAVDIHSLSINPVTEVPLTARSANVIDFPKYAEIYSQ